MEKDLLESTLSECNEASSSIGGVVEKFDIVNDFSAKQRHLNDLENEMLSQGGDEARIAELIDEL